MRLTFAAICMSVFLFEAVASAQTTVFEHDFQNATPGDLSGLGPMGEPQGTLGEPAVGTLSATGGFVSGTRPAYTTGDNGTSNAISVAAGVINDVGTPSGNFLTVNLSEPAAVTGVLGAGQTTDFSCSIASFGSANEVFPKLTHIVGLSSTGAEVFQLTYRAGSAGSTRELFAREFGEDNSTYEEIENPDDPDNPTLGLSAIDGDVVLDDVAFNISSTNTNVAPTGQIVVNVTIDEDGWNVSAAPTGGGSMPTEATGLGIASGATDLASIIFFTSHSSTVSAQNKGLWVDNILVTTDLTVEPNTDLVGDFNDDGAVDCDDLDVYIGNLGFFAAGGLEDQDLVADGTIDSLDVAFLVENLIVTTNGETGTFLGDLNCDGIVDVLGDAFILIGSLNSSVMSYSSGDITLDGTVDVLNDAFALVGNLGMNNTPPAAP